jgi:4-amino-4-deoxy-L-arabinose transferase-like glycosyltransferase
VHLAADFPDRPGWKDAAVVTDEGWYLNAATRHALTGGWYLPGDFNPAVALPVWPSLAALLFHFTGPGIVPARAFAVALLGIALACIALLLHRRSPLWVALLFLSFAVSSPFLFAFSRLALTETLLLCLLAVAMLLADHAAPDHAAPDAPRNWILVAVLGAVLLLMALAKLSALSLFPAVLYLLWHRLRGSPRRVIASFLLLGVIVAGGYGLYRAAVSASPFQSDFRYFYAANQFGHPANLKGWLISLRFSVMDLWFTCGWLSVLAFAALLASLATPLRSLRSESLFVAALLLVLGTSAFICARNYHAPHYYLFTPVALAILVALALRAAFEATPRRFSLWLVLPVAAVLLVFAIRAVGLVRHPAYTFLNAAKSVKDIIDREASPRRLLLAESGDQITLMTGQPSICDAFGVAPLREEIRQRDPGWFAAWDGVIPDTLAELHTRYHLQRVAAFPVASDPGRSVLLFYRLVPLTQPETGVLLRRPTMKFYRRPPASQ